MSNQYRTTMENPLYGVQSMAFANAVHRAREERSRVMRRLVETIFGRPDEEPEAPASKPVPVTKPENDDAEWRATMENLRFGRPF